MAFSRKEYNKTIKCIPESPSLLHLLEVGEERLVALSFQRLALHLGQDGEVLLLLKQLLGPRLHHDVNLLGLVIL